MTMTTNSTPKQLRTTLNFNIKYGAKGGTAKLLEMANEHSNITQMASYFGISNQRISHILDTLLGMSYSVWLTNQGVKKHGLYAHKEVSALDKDGDVVRDEEPTPNVRRVRESEL